MAEHTEPTVMVFGGSRRGRRRVTPGESVRLSVRIWSDHFDALQKNASVERVDFAEYVRTILADAATRKR